MSMLVLPIKKKWFDMIASGEKKEEYREIKDYYDTRIGNALCGTPLKWCTSEWREKVMNTRTLEALLRNGYGYNAPTIYCKCKVRIDYGKKECGKCGKKYAGSEMILLMRSICSCKKNLIRLCEDCYYDLLEFLNIEDVEIE